MVKTFKIGEEDLTVAQCAERADMTRAGMYERLKNANTPEELQNAVVRKKKQGQRNDLRRK